MFNPNFQTDPLTDVLMKKKVAEATPQGGPEQGDNPPPSDVSSENPFGPDSTTPPPGTPLGTINGKPASVGTPGTPPPNMAPEPAPAPTPAQYPTGSGANVNLAGFDSSRTDNDPKQVFGQFAQAWIASGKPWGADAVRAFVQQDPRWEIDPSSSQYDPHIRVKQSILDTWKPGTSIYQDVIGDSGGANNPQFLNVYGDTSKGYAAPGSNPAPSTPSSSSGGSGSSFNPVSPSSAGYGYTPGKSSIQDLIQSMLGGQQVQGTQAPSIRDLILSILQQGHA